MTIWALATRNAVRNKFRTFMTVCGGAVAVVAFIVLRTVPEAWNAGVESAAKDRLSTRNRVSLRVPMPRRYADDVTSSVQGVKSATYCTWFGARWPKAPSEAFPNVACAANVFEVYPEIEVAPDALARWNGDKQAAIVGDVLAKKLGLRVGDRVVLQGSFYPGDWELTIAGIYTAPPQSAVNRSNFFLRWDYKNDHVPERQRDMVDYIFTRVDSPSKSAQIGAAIDALFASRGIQTTTTSERAANNALLGGVSAVLDALDTVSIVILGIMTLILGNTIAMAVRERTTEYGVLRAVGFRPRQVLVLIVGESLTLSLLSGVVGVALALPIVDLGIGRALEENVGQFFPSFHVSAATMGAAVALTVALGAIASLLPALRVGRMPVTDALRRVA